MKTLITAAVAAAIAAPVLSQDATTFRYATVSPDQTFLADVDKAFMDRVTERTNGQVTFAPFWSSSLGSQGEIVALIDGGGVNLGAVSTGYQFGTFTFSGMTNAVPATFTSEQALEITAELFNENPIVTAELESLNLHPILIRHFSEYRLLCTEPLQTMSDFEGRRVRTYGPFVSRMFEELGAIPVAMESTEQYEGLQRGVIDCAFWNPSLMHLLRLNEVATHLSDLEFGAINAYTMFTSEEQWRSWPTEIQEAITKTADEMRDMSLEVMARADSDAIEAMTAGGVAIVPFAEPEAFAAAMPDMLEIWLQEVEAAVPEKLEDATSLLATVRSALNEAE